MTADAQAVAKLMQRINPDVQFKVIATDKSATATVDMALASPTSLGKSSVNGKARAMPSLMDEDSEGESDPSAAFAQTHSIRVVEPSPSLPNLSDDDEDDASKGASSAAPKRKKAPRAPRAAKAPNKVPETEEEKVERKLRREMERQEKKRKEVTEARRKARVDAGSLLAEALTVLDCKVPLGERWKVDGKTQWARAQSVHGVCDLQNKRAVLDNRRWLPPGFKRNDDGHTVYVESEAVKTKAEVDDAFLNEAVAIKERRTGDAHDRIRAFLTKKKQASATAAAPQAAVGDGD